MTREEMDLKMQVAITNGRNKKKPLIEQKLDLESQLRDLRDQESREVRALIEHKAYLLSSAKGVEGV